MTHTPGSIVRTPTTLGIMALLLGALAWTVAVGGCWYATWYDAHRKHSPIEVGVPIGHFMALAAGALLALAGLVLVAVALRRGERSAILWTGFGLTAPLAVPFLAFILFAVIRGNR